MKHRTIAPNKIMGTLIFFVINGSNYKLNDCLIGMADVLLDKKRKSAC